MDAIRPVNAKLPTFELADAVSTVFMPDMVLRHNSIENSATNGGRNRSHQVPVTLRAMSEARVSDALARAWWDCALSIQRLEGSRSFCGGRVCYANFK